MTLPYRWHPDGADHWRQRSPMVGDLIPFEHAVYRVIEAVDRSEGFPDDPKPIRLRVLPVHIDPATVATGDDRVLRMSASRKAWWDYYPDEHYPICAKCREPLPCREQMASKIAAESAAHFDRYTMPGVCPGCGEPVTQRQKTVTWEDNAVVPGGPPVTFHMRRKCRVTAERYERRWVAADPNRRRLALSCDGNLVDHGDGTYECGRGAECSGPQANHTRSYAACWYVGCTEHAPGDSNAPRVRRRQRVEGFLADRLERGGGLL